MIIVDVAINYVFEFVKFFTLFILLSMKDKS